MGNTEDTNTPANELETARPCVGKPAKHKRQGVGKHAEGLGHGIGDNCAHPQGASGLLISRRGCTPSVSVAGKGAVDIVADQGLHAIVRGTLAKLDDADEVGDNRNCARHAAQDGQFLLGRFALIVSFHDRWVEVRCMFAAGRARRLLLHIGHRHGQGAARVVA
jgi:hypothetical protein